VRDFGRRNPAAFIGGAVLVGLALGRFARASEPHATGLADADLTLAETEGYEGASMAGGGGLAAPLADDLGGLRATDEGDTATSLRGDDGTSGIGETDATTTPPSGGR
jgi:hypothetical protein